jgi:hypothetical protein
VKEPKTVFRSTEHMAANGDAISYSFCRDSGITAGGEVVILAFNETVRKPGPATDDGMPTKIGELRIHKDALIAFMASMVRESKADQLKQLGDLQALGL